MVDKSLCSFITNASYRLAVLVDCYINLSIDIFVLYIVLLAVKKCRTSIFEFIKRLEDHSSQIYSLNRYKERYDKKIDKEYLLGRYDAVPVFDEEIWEEMND